jgi:hypothetical protein
MLPLAIHAMWYPTKLQWFIIWMTTVVCLIGWLKTDPGPEAFIMPAAAVGALFFWQVSADFKRTKD